MKKAKMTEVHGAGLMEEGHAALRELGAVVLVDGCLVAPHASSHLPIPIPIHTHTPTPSTHPLSYPSLPATPQVEYSINDGGRPWNHAHPRAYERLLRRLLALPSQPLVLGLMLHSFHRHQVSEWSPVCLLVLLCCRCWPLALSRVMHSLLPPPPVGRHLLAVGGGPGGDAVPVLPPAVAQHAQVSRQAKVQCGRAHRACSAAAGLQQGRGGDGRASGSRCRGDGAICLLFLAL